MTTFRQTHIRYHCFTLCLDGFTIVLTLSQRLQMIRPGYNLFLLPSLSLSFSLSLSLSFLPSLSLTYTHSFLLGQATLKNNCSFYYRFFLNIRFPGNLIFFLIIYPFLFFFNNSGQESILTG